MIFSTKITKIHIFGIIFAILITVFLSWTTISNNNSAHSNDYKNPAHHKMIVAFLNNLGWKISKTPIETEEIIIPETFDKVCENYNQLQLKVGFDLIQFQNTKCTRYTYEILNFDLLDLKDQQVRANILIHDDKIIGGDICTVALDGFMIPLCDKKLANLYL